MWGGGKGTGMSIGVLSKGRRYCSKHRCKVGRDRYDQDEW